MYTKYVDQRVAFARTPTSKYKIHFTSVVYSIIQKWYKQMK